MDKMAEAAIAEQTAAAEASLYEFMRQAWPIVVPGVDFVGNWHLEGISLHLEAALRGEVKNLLINVPPGCGKSNLVNIFWPAWAWGPRDMAEKRFFHASYGQEISTRDSETCRHLLDSKWYQDRWGHRFRLADDQNQKTRYNTSKRGWRIATSVGGRGTGEHPDFLIVDDAHSTKEASSPAQRQEAIDWWDGTIAFRGMTRGVCRVVIGQRQHQNDLYGHLARIGEFQDHIVLPMEFEPDRMKPTSIGWTDHRKVAGELLWPGLIHAEMLKTIKKGARPHWIAGQLQQRPSAPGGEFFRLAWFENSYIDHFPLPRAVRAVRYWDMSSTKDGGDYTAGVLMVRHDDKSRPDPLGRPSAVLTVVDVVRGQWEQAERDEIIKKTTIADGERWPDYQIWHEQEAGSAGKDRVSAMARLLPGFRVHAHRPTGKKHVRADPWAVQLANGNVFIVRDGIYRKDSLWNAAYEDEHVEFRADETHDHDDQVDASSGAFNALATNNTPTIREMLDRGFSF